MPLPDNVFRVVKKTGKAYFYHQFGRHLPKEQRSALTRIPYEPRDPRFWQDAERLNGQKSAVRPKSFDALVGAFMHPTNPDWSSLSEGTKETYGVYLRKIKSAWGEHEVAALTMIGVVQMRDRLAAAAPSAANMFGTVLKILLQWGIGRDFTRENLARELKPLKTKKRHAMPWTEDAYEAARKGPSDIARFAYLGRVTGQRISDVLKMRPADLKGDILAVRVKKLQGSYHPVALSPDEIQEIKSWNVTDLAPFVARPNGKRYSEGAMRARLASWVEDDAPEAIQGQTILPHGLRAMAACEARLKGLSHEDIGALLRMSPKMVKTYTHHIDREQESRNAKKKLTAGKTS